MIKCRFGDVVREVKATIDRENNPYEYYIAGGHMDSEDLHIHRRGSFKMDDVGPAFIREFKKGQVLYGSRRTYLKKVAVADFDGVTANTTFVLETKDENVFLQELLPFLMLSESFTKWSITKSKGSTNPYVLFSDLENFEFELPSIEKQRELARLLWGIDETKCSYKELIQRTDDLVKSQFIEMFGDPRTNPMKWPVKNFNEIATSKIGLTYKPEDIKDGGILVLRSGNIQDSKISLNDNVYVNVEVKEDLLVKKNDILMCSRNGSAALVGKVALIPEFDSNVTFGAFMTVIRSRYYDYLFEYFQQPAFREQISAGTSTINQITQKMLSSINFPIPSEALQKQFKVFREQSDKSKF